MSPIINHPNKTPKIGVRNAKELVLLAEYFDITHSQPINPRHIITMTWNEKINIRLVLISLIKSSNNKDMGNKIIPETINLYNNWVSGAALARRLLLSIIAIAAQQKLANKEYKSP